MALPSNSGSRKDNPAQAWEGIKGTVGQVKANATRLRDDAAAGIYADRLTRFVETITDSLERLAVLAAVPGLLPYIREQLNDPAFDVVAEYNATRAAMESARSWILGAFPVDGNGYLLYHQFGLGGRIVVRQLAPAQLGGLVTELNALIATID
jgi:hypothetical protein